MRFLAAIGEIYAEGVIMIWSPVVCLKNKGEDKRETRKKINVSWIRGNRNICS